VSLAARLGRCFPAATLLCGVALAAGACAPAMEVPLASMDGVDPDVVRAVQEARAAVEANPTSGTAWGDLGDRYAAHHFLPEAVRCYARAEELEPESDFWAYRLGWITFMNGSPADAVAPLERALARVGAFYGPAHEAYGQVLLRLGRLDEAAEQFALASRLDPAGPQSETGLGQIAFQRGNLEVARGHLEAAIARDPGHGEAHIVLARVLHAMGRVEEAREHAERSRSLPQFSDRNDWLVNPSVPPAGSSARTEVAMQLEKQGKLDEAAENYRIAVESNPRSAMARKRLARILVKQGRKPEAIELLREAERQGVATQLTRDYLARLLGSKEAPEE
jgi:tetratricopeptide (TPR) repeat protein